MADYKPLQEKAYEYLKQKITTGQMQPNIIYSETKMSAEIGISRTPMKDALVRLSQDKYIDIIPSKGFCLHIMSNEDIWSTFQVRTAVEGFCALHLRIYRTTEEGRKALEIMEQSIHDMEQCLKDGTDIATTLSYDMIFHQTLVHFSANAELIQLFESYNHRLYDIAYKSLELPGRAEIALEEHRQIFRDICEDDIIAESRLYGDVMYHMTASRDIALASL